MIVSEAVARDVESDDGQQEELGAYSRPRSASERAGRRSMEIFCPFAPT